MIALVVALQEEVMLPLCRVSKCCWCVEIIFASMKETRYRRSCGHLAAIIAFLFSSILDWLAEFKWS